MWEELESKDLAGRMEDLRKSLGSLLITLAQVNKMDLSGKSDKLGLLSR